MLWVGPVFSAFLLSLSLPNEPFPFGLPLVGTIALIPVLLSVYQTDDWKKAARLGALFGALSTAVSNYWLAFYGEFSIWTIGGAVIGYTGYNYILFGYIYHLSRDRRFRSVKIATIWAGYEFLKSVGFLGYPWGLIAYPFAASPLLAQTVELTGVWGLSWIGAFVNTALIEVLLFPAKGTTRFVDNLLPRLQPPLAASLIVVVLAGFGYSRLHDPLPEEKAVTILLVQQNIDSWEPGRFEDALNQAQELTLQAIEESGKPDLVVWSETSLRRPYDPRDPFYDRTPEDYPFRVFLRDIDTPLLTGTPVWLSREDYELMNGAVLLEPDGRVQGTYGKQQLVPFAESIPYYRFDVVKRFFREVVGLYGTWLPGTGSEVMELPELGDDFAVGTPICFEDGFGWVPRELAARGARILVNLTNNSWSRQYSAQTQHFTAARLRTIELRRPLVRGTNSGFTVAIDPYGRISDSLPMFVSGTLFTTVSVPKPVTTLYLLIGNLFGKIFVVISLVWTYREYKKNGANPPGSVPFFTT